MGASSHKPESSRTTAAPEGWLLGFRDPRLENAYLQAEHERGRRYFATTLSIVTVLIASFLWTDPLLLPPRVLPLFHAARLYVLIPSALLLTINALWIQHPRLWIRQSAVLVTVFASAHPVLLLMAGPDPDVFAYLENGILELSLGTPLVLGLPLRWAAPMVALFGVSFGAVTLHVEADHSLFIKFCVDFVIYA